MTEYEEHWQARVDRARRTGFQLGLIVGVAVGLIVAAIMPGV